MNAAEEPKKFEIWKKTLERSVPNKEHNGVAQEARKLQYL